jgi:hypothetical protein
MSIHSFPIFCPQWRRLLLVRFGNGESILKAELLPPQGNEKSRREKLPFEVVLASAYVSTRSQPCAESRFNLSSERYHFSESQTSHSPTDLLPTPFTIQCHFELPTMQWEG